MIFDVTRIIFLRCRTPCPRKTADSIKGRRARSDCSTDRPSSASLLLLGPFYSLRHNAGEMTPVNNPRMASKRSTERKGHRPLTLRKLEMIKLSEEGVSKAEAARKLGLSCRTAQVWMQRKSS